MISKQQYEKLLPYRNIIIVARAVSGNIATELRQIYAEHGRSVNLGCRACVGSMLDYFTGVINDYESANEEKS
jgi:hypothetical protein